MDIKPLTKTTGITKHQSVFTATEQKYLLNGGKEHKASSIVQDYDNAKSQFLKHQYKQVFWGITGIISTVGIFLNSINGLIG